MEFRDSGAVAVNVDVALEEGKVLSFLVSVCGGGEGAAGPCWLEEEDDDGGSTDGGSDNDGNAADAIVDDEICC